MILSQQLRIGILCEVITAVADAEKNALQVSWTTVTWHYISGFQSIFQQKQVKTGKKLAVGHSGHRLMVGLMWLGEPNDPNVTALLRR